MPIYRVQAPDGKVLRIEGPDGASDEQLVRIAKGHLDMQRMADPTAGMTGLDKFRTGMGKAFSDLGQGLGQNLGLVSNEEVAETRRRDAPLMSSGAAVAGNISGNIAALAPAAFIPGAATVPGAALIGAASGALQPSESSAEAAVNVGLGALLSAGGQGLASKVSNMFKPAAPAVGREAGYTIPPSQQPGAGMVSRALEGFAGKTTTAQQASTKNQEVTNRLARETLGLSPDAPLNTQTLNAVRKQAGQSYEAVRQFGTLGADDIFLDDLGKIAAKYSAAETSFPGLGKSPITEVIESLKQPQFSSGGALDAISILRDKADVAFRSGDKGLGKAFRESADAMEGVIERNLAAKIGQEAGPQNQAAAQILNDFRQGRELIAKTYSIERALNETTGNVSTQALAGQLSRGRPLSGGLKTAAEFGRSFPKAAQRPETIGSQPGISPLDIIGSGILGGAGALATGDSSGGMAALIPFLRPAARAAILSRSYQSAVGGPGALSGIRGVAGNEALIEEILRRSSVPVSLGLTANTPR